MRGRQSPFGTCHALRDIELKLGFEAPGGQLTDDLDKVKATAVWSKKIQFFNMGNNHPADLDEQVLINNVQSGLGLEELSGLANDQGQRFWGVEAIMLAQFKVFPDDIGDENSVKFDITRQKERLSFFVINGNTVGPPDANFPVKKDLSNDDDIGIPDEDNEPKNNHIFSLDAPKALLIQAQGQAAPPDGTSFTYSGNFNEFVRVSFDGNKPAGNNLSGSRCSNKLIWNTQQVAIKQNGTIVRNGQKNWIREGHEQLIAKP